MPTQPADSPLRPELRPAIFRPAGPRVIGLTGGIGAGKSTVLGMLRELGGAAVDSDAISRSGTAPGGIAIRPIAARFGPEFIDEAGGLDRERMRRHVFADPEARRELERITHPLIRVEIARQAKAALATGARWVVLDLPLLVEAQWLDQVDKVLVVDCEPETQVARVVARSGLSRADVRAIIAAQAPRATRLAAADVVVYNEGVGLPALREAVTLAARALGLC